MAKQTFTTGQVLTAAQMTSLQQTAMLGGAASAKTASYTLVAADAGTAISMSNASATTITVNTGLFAAGDTVQITNIGAGVCTITAGTATVNTAASLALAQYESGTLNFTSTSAAIFIKGAGAAASSGGMTLLSTTTLSSTSVLLSSIPQTYKNLQLIIRNFLPATDGFSLQVRMNDDSNANRHTTITTSFATNETFGSTSWTTGGGTDNTTSQSLMALTIFDYTNTVTWKTGCNYIALNNEATPTNVKIGSILSVYNQTSAISSIRILTDATSFSGTALLYGVS